MILCGIDEAGRGPIAGDLVVAGCILLNDIDGLDDSKKLTPKKRENLFKVIKQNSNYHIVKKTPKDIDTKGLSVCIKEALEEIMEILKADEYIFDGNSTFGVKNLKTMIKADSKVKEVSAASILAKVTRDNDMIKLSKLYPNYNFAKHKGYITKEHIKLIKKYGFCDIHRKSYKVKGLESTLF